MKGQSKLITLNQVSSKGGVLSSIQADANLPMEIRRSYWIYDTEENAARGHHVHLNSSRILVCLTGMVEVVLENKAGRIEQYQLNIPSQALYIPPLHWINLSFAKGTILLVFASCLLEDDIMLKKYQEFKSYQPKEGVV